MATLVQHRTATVAGGATSASLAFTNPTIIGNRAIAGLIVGSGASVDEFTSITDNGSPVNSYHTDIDATDPHGVSNNVICSANIANNPGSGNLQITWTIVSTQGGGDCEIQEVNGLSQALNAVDTTGNTSPGTSNNAASVTTSAATSQSSEYCYALFGLFSNPTGVSGASGTVIDDIDQPNGTVFTHKFSAGGSTETANISWTGSASQWNGTMVAYLSKTTSGLVNALPGQAWQRHFMPNKFPTMLLPIVSVSAVAGTPPIITIALQKHKPTRAVSDWNTGNSVTSTTNPQIYQSQSYNSGGLTPILTVGRQKRKSTRGLSDWNDAVSITSTIQPQIYQSQISSVVVVTAPIISRSIQKPKSRQQQPKWIVSAQYNSGGFTPTTTVAKQKKTPTRGKSNWNDGISIASVESAQIYQTQVFNSGGFIPTVVKTRYIKRENYIGSFIINPPTSTSSCCLAKVGTTIPTVTRAAAATVSPTFASDMPRNAGDLLIARVYASSSNAITCSDNTWSQVAGTDVISAPARCQTFFKVAAGGDAAPTFSSTGASKMIADLEEFSGNDTTSPLQTSSVGSATATSGTTLTVTAGAAPSMSCGISITTAGTHDSVAATSTETPGTGWVSGGWGLTSSDNAHAGGDYHLNPSTSAADSELITVTDSTNAFVAQIAFFKPCVSAAGARPIMVIAIQKPKPTRALANAGTNTITSGVVSHIYTQKVFNSGGFVPIVVSGKQKKRPSRSASDWNDGISIASVSNAQILQSQRFNSGGFIPLLITGIQKSRPRRGKSGIVFATASAIVAGTQPIVFLGVKRQAAINKHSRFFAPSYNSGGLAPSVTISTQKKSPTKDVSDWNDGVGIISTTTARINRAPKFNSGGLIPILVIGKRPPPPRGKKANTFAPPYNSGGIKPSTVYVIQKRRPLSKLPTIIKGVKATPISKTVTLTVLSNTINAVAPGLFNNNAFVNAIIVQFRPFKLPLLNKINKT